MKLYWGFLLFLWGCQSSSITLKWNRPENGKIIGYHIFHTDNDGRPCLKGAVSPIELTIDDIEDPSSPSFSVEKKDLSGRCRFSISSLTKSHESWSSEEVIYDPKSN